MALLLGFTLAQNAPPPKPGVKTPGVKMPIERLQPEAIFPVPGSPDWIAVDEDVWISNKPKDSVTRLAAKTNTVAATIPVGKRPCSGLAAAFGSLWVPNCGDSTLSRVDLKTGTVTATIPSTIGNSEGSIVAGAGSIWIMTDAKGTLARIDPATNTIVAEVYVEAGYSYGQDAEPAEGAAVTVTGADGKPVAAGATDERGVWTFPRPSAGTYTVVVEQAGHRTAVTLAVPESGTVAFFPSRLDERVGVAVGVAVVLGLTLAYRSVRRRQSPASD